MTASTATAPAPRLDVGDGMTYDRADALLATRYFMAALFTLLEGDGGVVLVEKLADFLGGEQWMDVAEELVDEALKLGPVTPAAA